jgi:hypothetical protein
VTQVFAFTSRESLVLGVFLDPVGQECLGSLEGSASLPAIETGVDPGGEEMCEDELKISCFFRAFYHSL